MKNVNIRTTGMNKKSTKEKRSHSLYGVKTKPLVIADVQFLFRLFRQYPDPFPAEIYPEMLLPYVLTHGLPSGLLIVLQKWLQNGTISFIGTDHSLFEEAAQINRSPGMLTTDYIALLLALQNKLSIISSTKIITGEASRLKVQVTDGILLLQSFENGATMKLVKQKKAKKNNIILSGEPALIAGNN
jgi:hypothetical protein